MVPLMSLPKRKEQAMTVNDNTGRGQGASADSVWLDRIAVVLNAGDWSADTLDELAELVRASGRPVEDSDDEVTFCVHLDVEFHAEGHDDAVTRMYGMIETLCNRVDVVAVVCEQGVGEVEWHSVDECDEDCFDDREVIDTADPTVEQ